MEVQCERHCGFRADLQYFERKTRFQAGICPRCNGPIEVVREGTDIVVLGWTVQRDRNRAMYGKITLAAVGGAP